MMFDVHAISLSITTATALVEVLILGVAIAAIYPAA
jgi:hypothetical protein